MRYTFELPLIPRLLSVSYSQGLHRCMPHTKLILMELCLRTSLLLVWVFSSAIVVVRSLVLFQRRSLFFLQLKRLACRRAINFALEIGIIEAEVDGDSAVIINFLNYEGFCLVRCGHVIEDSQTAAKDFKSISFSHVRRTGNSIAQHLAKKEKVCWNLIFGWRRCLKTFLLL